MSCDVHSSQTALPSLLIGSAVGIAPHIYICRRLVYLFRHELAVTAIADLQTGLQRSHNREKKLRSTLAALVDATQGGSLQNGLAAYCRCHRRLHQAVPPPLIF